VSCLTRCLCVLDAKRPKLDAEAEAFLVRECCTDLGQLPGGLAVALVFLDGEDVNAWIAFIFRAAVKTSSDVHFPGRGKSVPRLTKFRVILLEILTGRQTGKVMFG